MHYNACHNGGVNLPASQRLQALVKVAWTFQIMPLTSDWGMLEALSVWSRRRVAIDELLDEDEGFPTVERGSLIDPDGVSGVIALTHERVIPIPPMVIYQRGSCEPVRFET